MSPTLRCSCSPDPQRNAARISFEPDETWLPVSKFLEKPINPRILADEAETLLKLNSKQRKKAYVEILNILIVDDEYGMRRGAERALRDITSICPM